MSPPSAPTAHIPNGSRFQPATHERLWKMAGDFGVLAQRFRHVASIHAELVRLARGKSFTIHHAVAWRMALAERDMVAIDAASWVRGLYKKGGFLRSLHGPDLRALARRGGQPKANEWRSAAYKRLFPGAAKAQRGVPNRQDLDALAGRVWKDSRALVDDRDAIRAHRFEPQVKANVQALDLPATAAHLRLLETLLVDLFRLSGDLAYLRWELDPDPKDVEARDAVDLILCGPLNWIVDGPPSGRRVLEPPTYKRRRSEYYESLHAVHEREARADAPFNGPFLGG